MVLTRAMIKGGYIKNFVIRVRLEFKEDVKQVGYDVSMGQHGPFGKTRRPTGIKDIGDIGFA